MTRLVRWTVVVVVLAATGAGAWVWTARREQATRFRTARIERGAIVASVSTTGTLNAVTTVQVGSQVSGQIKEILADFNARVRKDQLIARLDPEVFQARLNAARADLENARAAVLNQQANVERARAEVENVRAAGATAEANVERMRAEVENARAVIATTQANVTRESATVANARRELDRRLDLLRRELIAQSEKDQAQTTFDTAQAQLEAVRAQERAGQAALRSAQAQVVAAQSQGSAAHAQLDAARAALAVAEAQRQAAEASVRQKQAAVDQARFDLDRTEIRSPVDGVVVSRNVDVGQTVAASLQAPTLFTIAEDLTRMQVEAAVDEADIGRLREGMPAGFTVDAFPGQSFRGNIVQIRKAAQVVQNVVTYTVVIATANPRGILMPGMTANVRIQVDRREDVLRVPNAALRFRPPTEGAEGRSGTPGRPAGSPAPAPAQTAGSPEGAPGGGSVASLRETLIRDLALTAEQRARLDAILGEARQAFAALRGQTLEERAREAERRRIRAGIQDKVREILTPQQRAPYEAIVAAQDGTRGGAPSAGTPGRVFVPGPDGTPRPVAIVVGVSDGTYSELLQGDLAAGQEVVVGLGPGGASRPSGGGPRLRL